MARRLIGLDVGTNAVTIAEVAPGAPPRLDRFGQVALPRDAMNEGEIADDAAVTEAIIRLREEVDLRKAPVRVGAAGPRLIVRQVEMPVMSRDELKRALQFQAGDLIPIPLDEAVLDFVILGNTVGEDGDAVMQVLLAAAQKNTVMRLVAAVEAAGLPVAAVDLVPLALIRTLARPAYGEDSAAEGIVSFGGGVTAIVVHEKGVPRFVRVLGTGGRELTDAIGADLDVPLETAEALKRQLAVGGGDELLVRASAAIERPLSILLDEVRSSLDYYRNQPGASRMARVVATGGASQLPGIVDRLAALVGVPVEMARPRELLAIGDIRFPEEEYPRLDPYLPGAAGLALGGAGMGTVVDLLPRDKRGSRNAAASSSGARSSPPIAVGVAAGIGLLAALAVPTFMKHQDVASKKDDLATIEAQNTKLESEKSQYATVQAEMAQVTGLKTQVEGLLATDVSWASMVNDIAATMPNEVWLTSFQGQVTAVTAPAVPAAATGTPTAAPTTPTTAAPGAAAPATPATPAATPLPGGLTGQVAFEASARAFPDVAAWIERISTLPAFAQVWVTNATLGGTEEAPAVDFSSKATLTSAAQSNRLEEVPQRAGDTMKNRSVMIGALAAVFIVIVWWFMVFSGMNAQSTDVADDITAAEGTNDALTRELAGLKQLQENAEEISAEREALTETLTEQPNLAAFIREADFIGFTNGVDWVSVSPTDPVQTGSVATTALTIEVEGEYLNVLRYLRALEDMPRLLVVDGIVLSGGEGSVGTPGEGQSGASDGPPRLHAALTARMFSLSAVQAPAAATTDTTVAAPADASPEAGGE